jgi:hypothetical protein
MDTKTNEKYFPVELKTSCDERGCSPVDRARDFQRDVLVWKV